MLIRMCQEVVLGGESVVLDVLHGFVEHLPIERIVELDTVGLEAVVDIFGNGQRDFFAFLVLYQSQLLLAVSHKHLHEGSLYAIQGG